MNKGRRNELKRLKFVKRLKQLGLIQDKNTNYNCYKTTGKPCSCIICSPNRYFTKGQKKKKQKEYKNIISEANGRNQHYTENNSL